MCGISGIISKNKIELASLRRISDTIKHRGPDGNGHWLNEKENVGFSHNRLAIIDLSDNGKQPMHYEERYTITFNGEIYNYLELRRELEVLGCKFKTNTDTEVILALYSKEKERCLQKLDGMFAFAIYDRKEEKVFCARDRFGEKPFYYACNEKKEFVFCSEIKGLLQYGINDEVNYEMLYNFLETSHILHNYSKPEQTFYRSISKLKKASYLYINKELNIQINEYWNLDHVKENNLISFDEAAKEFKKLFYKSIELRLRSDVAIGSSLSGGLDSSSIVAVINQINKNVPQHTFSARFKNYNRDEGHYIDLVTNKFDVNKHFTWPDEQNFLEDFENMMWHQDEPVGSASIYAQYAVMKKAKEERVTVLLDGQGADEILAGYEYYLNFYLENTFKFHPDAYADSFMQFSSLHKHLNFNDLRLKNKVTTKVKKINPLLKFYKPKIYKQIKDKLPLPGFYTKAFAYSFNEDPLPKIKDKTGLNEYLKYSVSTDNLEDLLRYSDRNSMAHGREVRLPFLSHHVVEFLFSLPAEFKIFNGWTKYLLRESMKDVLPDEITWRLNKVGYEPPQSNWLNHKKINELSIQAFEKLKAKKIIDQKAVLSDKYKWAVLSTCFLK